MDKLLRGRAQIGWPSYELAAVGVFVVLGFTVFIPVQIGAAVLGTSLLLATPALGAWPDDEPERIRNAALLAAVVLLGADIVGRAIGEGGIAATSAVSFPFVLVAGFLALRGRLEEWALRTLAAGLLVLVVAAVGTTHLVAQPLPDTDVFYLHVSAAGSLSSGRNPYIEATAANTAPTAEEGETVVGYPYPPLDLVAYAGGHVLFGDPRWTSVIAVAITVLLIIRPWARLTRAQAGAAVALSLAIVTQPVLGPIFRNAWTEPIALPLLMGVGLLWRKHPMGAAVLLGLVLGLKQYWILALPLLLIWNDDYRWKRFWLAGGVAALSLLPAFLAAPGAAWNSMVVNLMDVPPRLDSIGFAGIGWNLPMWLIVMAAVVAAWWMGRQGGPAPRFLLGLLGTLSVAFLLGSQAFVNYWFLIANAAIVAVATTAAMNRHAENPDRATRPGHVEVS